MRCRATGIQQRPGPSGSVTFDSSLARFPDEGNRGQDCSLFPSDPGRACDFPRAFRGPVLLSFSASPPSPFHPFVVSVPFLSLSRPLAIPSSGGIKTSLSLSHSLSLSLSFVAELPGGSPGLIMVPGWSVREPSCSAPGLSICILAYRRPRGFFFALLNSRDRGHE